MSLCLNRKPWLVLARLPTKPYPAAGRREGEVRYVPTLRSFSLFLFFFICLLDKLESFHFFATAVAFTVLCRIASMGWNVFNLTEYVTKPIVPYTNTQAMCLPASHLTWEVSFQSCFYLSIYIYIYIYIACVYWCRPLHIYKYKKL